MLTIRVAAPVPLVKAVQLRMMSQSVLMSRFTAVGVVTAVDERVAYVPTSGGHACTATVPLNVPVM